MAKPTFGGYTALTTATTAQNKTDIVANLTLLKNLLDPEGVNATPVFPDFNVIPQSAAQQLRNELDGLIAVVNASP